MITEEELIKEIKNCSKCQLCSTKRNYVISGGNIKSAIMVIGEAPGGKEDETGNVFVGPAGQLLDKMLGSIGLDRTQVYITNVCKCRPPENRNPTDDEIKTCIGYLRTQFRIMRPKFVLLLGSVAGKTVLGKDFRITKSHGNEYNIKGTVFLPTFHPSALLRDPSKKRDAYNDLLNFKRIIHLSN